MKEFKGNSTTWQKWKSKTNFLFDGSIYNKILSSQAHVESNKKRNKFVYSQLSAATVNGTAHHFVKKFAESKDEYAA